jgi:hypothetical protein
MEVGDGKCQMAKGRELMGGITENSEEPRQAASGS